MKPLILLLLLTGSVYATEKQHGRPVHNPNSGSNSSADVRIANVNRVATKTSQTVEVSPTITNVVKGSGPALESGAVTAFGKGGAGGAGGISTIDSGAITNRAGDVAGGSVGTVGANTFKGGDTETAYLNFAMAMVNINGCISAKHIGGGGDSGGGLIQWTSADKTCILNAMADAERHVATRARLKCADKVYRNAITYETPKGVWGFNKKRTREKQKMCVDWTVQVTRGEIDYLSELLEETVDPVQEGIEAGKKPLSQPKRQPGV